MRFVVSIFGLAITLSGCDEFFGNIEEPKPPSPDTGIYVDDGQTDATGKWVVQKRDLTNCASTPAPRQHAAMAFFVADSPVRIAGRWLDRGFLVAGGLGAASLLEDAWVFDVGAPPSQCPWLLVSEHIFEFGPDGGLNTDWVIEGMPTLLATSRYPGSGGRDSLLDNRQRFDRAVNDIVWSRLKDDRMHHIETAPEEILDPQVADEATQARAISQFVVAPYLLSQLAFTTAAVREDVASPSDALSDWRAPLSGDPLRELTRNNTRSFINSRVPGFWDAWIDDANSEGIPLLGLESISFGPPVTAIVRQWQVDWFGWPAFADVPYMIGCNPQGQSSQIAFEQCHLTRHQIVDDTPSAADGTTATFQIELTPTTALSYPALFALLSGPSLLPGGPPTYNLHNGNDVLDPRSPHPPARTWMALCNGATTGLCSVASGDVDGDGHPNATDCRRPAGSTTPASSIYHLAPEQPIGTDPDWFDVDANCDGWPTPLMIQDL